MPLYPESGHVRCTCDVGFGPEATIQPGFSFLQLTNAGVKNAGDRYLPPAWEEVLTRFRDSCLTGGKLEDDLDFSLRPA
jgi:hypothetical protein